MYKGAIIEESLIDNRILNDLDITDITITDDENPDDRWHIYSVLINKEDISGLSTQMKPEKWYMHFWRQGEIIVVFPNKIFVLNDDDNNTRDEAIKYGLSIDISLEQLTFDVD